MQVLRGDLWNYFGGKWLKHAAHVTNKDMIDEIQIIRTCKSIWNMENINTYLQVGMWDWFYGKMPMS